MARAKRRQPYDPSKAHDRRAGESNRGVENYLTPKEVDDPYEAGGKIIVMRSTRDDPLARLHDRRQIDEAQYHGGRAFQRDFEIAERGPRAIDPSKEAVDGGLAPEPITEQQRKSALRLVGAYRALKQDKSAVVQDVLIHRRTMAIISERRGLSGRKWEEYFGKMFRDGLELLAEFYGFSNHSDGRRRLTNDRVD